MANITYRQLITPEEFLQAVQLQREVWGLRDADLLAAHSLRVFIHVGGVVLGALDGDQLVGFTAALPRRNGDQWSLWSDMMGVHPNYQRLGIGIQLKLNQREWALAHGYPAIGWTFDPLQRGNANLNIRRLKTTANVYHVNLYGVFDDNLSAGMRTDRLEVNWTLNEERRSNEVQINSDMPFLLSSDENGDLNTAEATDTSYYRVEIPMHIVSLKQSNIQKAREWQLKLASVMQSAFSNGYSVVNFVTVNDRCWYVLSK